MVCRLANLGILISESARFARLDRQQPGSLNKEIARGLVFKDQNSGYIHAQKTTMKSYTLFVKRSFF